MPKQSVMIIDDRSTGNFLANHGEQWQLVTDNVMGGISDGELSVELIEGKSCLRMHGEVSLENNGGFIQSKLALSEEILDSVVDYQGLLIEVYGNDEQYNVHLRTDELSFPWQSYRVTFSSTPEWQQLFLPFNAFTPYRIDKTLDISRLQSISLVAIGRRFCADLCVGFVGFYN